MQFFGATYFALERYEIWNTCVIPEAIEFPQWFHDFFLLLAAVSNCSRFQALRFL